MNALTEYVHSKGLKIGLYSSPGPKTCAGHEGSYKHEEQDVARRLVQSGAHDLVGLQQGGVVGTGGDFAVAAPIIFEVIEPPFGIAPGILLLVLVAAFVAGARLGAGRGIKTDL